MASSTSAPKTSASSSSFHADATPANSATGAAKTRLPGASGNATSQQHNCQPSSLSFSSSVAFQQVKQTQASLARLSRVHNHHNNHNQQQQQQHLSQTNQSSQQVSGKSDSPLNSNSNSNSVSQSAAATAGAKSTTFIDCLIRRFKDCFSEDFCTVPMFVVGNLSPGSDGK